MELAALIVAILALVTVAVGVFVSHRSWRASTHKNIKDDGEWKGRVDTLLKKIGEDLERIGKELADLRGIVFSRFGSPMVISKSPLRLSELGKTVSEKITAQAWVEKVEDALNEEVKGKDAYEIQDFCFKYVKNTDQYNDKEREAIRHTAYKLGVKAEDVLEVLAIELRDKLLKNAGLGAP